MFKKFLKQQEGFTLVELLIVILILGALAAVAIPRFINMQQDAVISTCRNNQASIETAIEQYMYYNAHDSAAMPIPGAWTLATLTATYTGVTINGVDQTITLLKRTPACPGGGNYVFGANGTVNCSLAPAH